MSGQQQSGSREPRPSDQAVPGSPDVVPAGRIEGAPDAAPGLAWPAEVGGQAGPEPTRYGDWEKNGRCTDF